MVVAKILEKNEKYCRMEKFWAKAQ